MKSLFRLNKSLYNWHFHVSLFIIFISLAAFAPLWTKIYLLCGLVLFIGLALYRVYNDRNLSFLKEKKLGILVALNLCLLFSFFSFFLVYLIHLDKEKSLKNKN